MASRKSVKKILSRSSGIVKTTRIFSHMVAVRPFVPRFPGESGAGGVRGKAPADLALRFLRRLRFLRGLLGRLVGGFLGFHAHAAGEDSHRPAGRLDFFLGALAEAVGGDLEGLRHV